MLVRGFWPIRVSGIRKERFMVLLIENDVKAMDIVSRELAREFRRSIRSFRTLLKRDLDCLLR
ncbi:hypothetical protein DRO64_04970 [Candidatus Bathyarchaeota archaeon]|nr:MAG: hypothetical protein DRO64_04970 [Candidatus Bathyarchaeota archaeon]